MNEQMNEKKIRWNIPKAMACVYQALKESKLKIKKTKPYTTAMENLKTLYNLTQTQIWLLCIICENYFEEEDSTSMKDVSYTLKVPVMTIMNWKAERDKLEERGFIEHRGNHDSVQPVSEFRESLINNVEFVPPEKKESDDKTIMRSMDESDEYVKLARKTIETFIKENIKICLPNDLPKDMTDKRAGAFVSIHKYGQLRGCIGTILPTTGCIGEEIIQNAISASTSDPRFPAITENELSALEISVDVLGEPEDIPSPDYLDVKKYGVIVTKGFKRGLLLPDLDGVDTVEDQIAIAKRKAGIGYDEDVKLQRFEVIRHH